MRVHGNSRKGPTPPLLIEFVREKLHMSMPDSFFIDSNVSTRVNGVEVSGLDDVFCHPFANRWNYEYPGYSHRGFDRINTVGYEAVLDWRVGYLQDAKGVVIKYYADLGHFNFFEATDPQTLVELVSSQFQCDAKLTSFASTIFTNAACTRTKDSAMEEILELANGLPVEPVFVYNDSYDHMSLAEQEEFDRNTTRELVPDAADTDISVSVGPIKICWEAWTPYQWLVVYTHEAVHVRGPDLKAAVQEALEKGRAEHMQTALLQMRTANDYVAHTFQFSSKLKH